jgi:lipopolysaccharide/colanic/teichoic acid biosynthesis glycosyltransferase
LVFDSYWFLKQPSTVTAVFVKAYYFGLRKGLRLPVMLLELRQYLSHRERALRLPWLMILDIIGLVFALSMVIIQIDSQFKTSEGRVFVILLMVFALNARFFLGQMRTLETALGKNRTLLLLSPVVASVSTLVVQALSRSYYSGMAILIFVIIWGLWIMLMRFIYQRYRPILNVLLIEPCDFKEDLSNLHRVSITSLQTPPSRFRGFDVVVVDPSRTYNTEWLQWLAHADMYGVRTITAPLVVETLARRVPVNMLHGVWAFEILSASTAYLIWKRLLDILAVILLAPFLLLLSAVVALVIYFDSGGPVLFRQKRVGRNGVPFTMVKFRTMKTNSEENGAAFATKQDPRITKVGQFLRKFRLDELPQFWNVFKGDMSIIGPRPEQAGFAREFENEIPLYNLRHNVRPGITGWAQVMHGYAASTDETREKICYDFYYVKQCSLSLDLRIVYLTVLTILTGFGSR